MAKTESTAVNELISLVSGQQPVKDSDEDLMFRDPADAPAKVTPPRMSAQIPAMRGSGSVTPLPRSRAPNSTEQNIPAIPPPRPQVRSMTAPPSRGTTIPPLSRGSSAQLEAAAPPVPPMRPTKPSIPPPRPSPPSHDGTPAPVVTRPSGRTSTMPPLPPPRPSGRMSAQLPVVRPAEPAPPPAVMRPSEPEPAPWETEAPAVIRPSARTEAPASMPVAAPFEPMPREAHPFSAPVAAPIDMTSHEPWFEPSGGVERIEAPVIDSGTVQVAKPSLATRAMIVKLIGPMIGLVVVGVFVGGFFAFNGEGGHHHAVAATSLAAPAAAPLAVAAAEPAAAAEPVAPVASAAEPVAPAAVPAAAITAPAAAAVVPPAPAAVMPSAPAPVAPAPAAIVAAPPAPAPAIAAQPTLVDVRIDSRPAGATVMLVDRGRSTFLGTTPMSAGLDPKRTYDVVFTFANRPTQVEHLDPKVTSHLAITLGHPGNTAVETKAKAAAPKQVAVAAPAPAHAAPAPAHAAPAPAHVAPVAPVEAPKHVDAPKPVLDDVVEKKPEPAGNGTLMISSKPPCEIWVDGKDTGLSTPQRALPLAAGNHKITLVNAAQSLNKTVAVQITADKPTKVIQDLMK